MKQGVKHIVECHCVLPQYRNRTPITYHNFVVFSIIDESGTVVPKHAACNNCGVIHNVIDICKSEVLPGREMGAVMSIEDVKLLLPSSLTTMLEAYDCEVPTWEHVLFTIQHNLQDKIVLSRDNEEGIISGKILNIQGPGKYTLEPYSRRDTL